MMQMQFGQSMVEYTIVTSAIVTALLYASSADCPGYDSCVGKLLTSIHDSYDGYSASISAVQKYPDVELAEPPPPATPTNNNSAGSDGTGGSGFTSPGGFSSNTGLNEIQVVSSSLNNLQLGTLQTDGSVLDQSGNAVGFYDQETGEFITTAGNTVDVTVTSEIYDQDGNRLYARAVVDCQQTEQVYGWAYVSPSTGEAFNTLNRNTLNLSGYCTVPSYGITNDGQAYPGRVVAGLYYQNTVSIRVGSQAQTSNGELIFLEDSGSCLVARTDWDLGEGSLSSSEAEELIRREENFIGELDALEYFDQTQSTDCPSSREF
jgi:hypothetical protein